MIIEYSTDKRLQGSPAMVNLATGKVYVNKDLWDNLTDYEKSIVLLHEEGHYKNCTLDEIKADAYAVDKYLAECDNPKRRQELVHTIFKNIDSSPANVKRRMELVRYLLQYDEKNNHSKQSARLNQALKGYAYWVGTAITLIGGVYKLGISAYNLYQVWKNRTKYFDDYTEQEREDIINQCADAVIYDEFLSCGGNLTELYAEASAGVSNPNGLAYKTFLTINQIIPISPAWFGNINQITAEEGSAKFWKNAGYDIPSWFQQRVDYLSEELEDYWDNLSLFDKIKYSTSYKIYAVVYILILVLLWQKL